MKLIKLSPEEQLSTGFKFKAILTYADFATAGTASDKSTVQLFPVSGSTATGDQWLVRNAVYRVTTAFAGSDNAVIGLSITTNPTANDAIANTSVVSGGTLHKAQASPIVFTADHLDAVLTFASGKVASTLSAGAVDVYFDAVRISDLDRNV